MKAPHTPSPAAPRPLPCPPELWPDFSRLLDEALDLPPSDRDGWLDRMRRERPDLAPHLAALFDASLPHPATDAFAALATEGPHADYDGPTSGDSVGPYELVRELGRGGMGAVWLATRSDGAYEREVALKLPHAHLTGGPALRRFRRERDILASLAHPNIAQLYDAGVTQAGRPYLALELVIGEPITSACRKSRASLDARVALVEEVAAALAAAHSRLVVHRDLKPSNVLVTAKGSTKLLDFGIAKLLEPEETSEAGADGVAGEPAPETALTIEGSRLATPDYAAPEQLTGMPVSVATDVHALGLLLFELLTGNLPHARGSGSRRLAGLYAPDAETALASRRIDPEHPDTVGARSAQELSRALSGDLDAILARALATEPTARYLSAEAFADDLARYRRGEPIRARRLGRLARVAKFARRHRASVGLAAALALATLVGIGAVLWQSAATAREARRANATLDFLAEIFRGADPRIEGDRPRSLLTARELLDLTSRRLETSTDLDDETRAEIGDQIATIYAYLDDTGPARALASRTTAALANEAQPNDPRLFDALFFEVWLALQDGDLPETERRLAELDARLIRTGMDGSRHRAEWHLASSDVAAAEGRSDARKVALEKAIAIYERTEPSDRGHAAALSNLGELVLEAGEPTAALSLFDRAVAVLGGAGAEVGTDRARLDTRRGEALVALGRRTDARRAFEESRHRFAGTIGLDHPTAWTATAGLAAILESEGDSERAAALVREIEASAGWLAPVNRERRAAVERLLRVD